MDRASIWHALAARHPVGNIQRLRGAVYQASARHRGASTDGGV